MWQTEISSFGKQVKFYGAGRLRQGQLNKTEEEYNSHLKTLLLTGLIVWYKFEGLKFRLADNTFYTPDFIVLNNDFLFEVHEVKGFWTDDAKVKIKVAADMYPFKFMAFKKVAKKHGGGWSKEDF